MPELPEVNIIVKRLRSYFKGCKIRQVDLVSPKVIKGIPSDIFLEKVVGHIINDICCKGKHILFFLDNNMVIVLHLKITGKIVISKKVPKFTRVVFFFEGKDTALCVCDQRSLLEFRLFSKKDLNHFLSKLGPEPLTKEFDLNYFKDKVRTSRAKLKPFLMNQSIIAGLGNIYASEILFRARLRPDRVVSSLSDEEIKRLYSVIKKLVSEAIDHGALLEKHYFDGSSYPSFKNELYVYNRANQRCKICGGLVKKMSLAGRSSYFCPTCQH